ncbi:predicted protein [Botrytis cinerea T4]|uniref:Uncharacterized protein n=1 Tax=Botryotinia fuckeliana (strain T4) TaxID=999810 RepID=G2YR39_BOTF4|nr:predicted protein [Botrytis cinerea T4]
MKIAYNVVPPYEYTHIKLQPHVVGHTPSDPLLLPPNDIVKALFPATTLLQICNILNPPRPHIDLSSTSHRPLIDLSSTALLLLPLPAFGNEPQNMDL